MGEPANRLAQESSPYLLQHAHNPVDWYPWGDEAFERAKREGKPIFLSIGYSTCHWCHVMERESFENAEIAALMNRDFVSIKVDREERPDIDNVYMTACQLLTRSGGWPLTAILTPDGRPFFAGTYFPPGGAHGRPGMRTLLPRIAEYWKNHRAEAESQAKEVETAVRSAIASPPKENAAPLDASFSASVAEELARRFDPEHGGFSTAPKFPPHGAIELLASRADGRAGGEPARAGGEPARAGGEPARAGGEPARAGGEPARDVAMLRRTLDEMRDGGVFDQVGGGFHRYSVDAEWFVPHFEKMLYDNAQLLGAYAAASRRFAEPGYADTARAIAAWLERDMKTPEGGYAAALDADSEGIEGKYYLWTAPEIDAALGPAEAPLWREAFGIADRGNTPPEFAEGRGKNLPRRVRSDAALAKSHGGDPGEIRARLERDDAKLEEIRARRVPPSRDDKVLTSWNALAVSALARASRDLPEPKLAVAARRIADFLLAAHVSGGRVLHGSRGGKAKIAGFLEDYAFLADALLDLAEATGQKPYAERAREIAAEMVRRFGDDRAGGFFQTEAPASGDRGLLDLAKEYLDQVVPSPNAVAVRVLRRLDAESPAPELRRVAAAAVASAAPYARTFPSAATSWAILAAGTPAAPAARPASAERGPVRLRARRGDGEVAVDFSIDPGWHVQSRNPSRPELVPTRVTLRTVGTEEPAYPAAGNTTVAGDHLAVYSGDFSVTAKAPGIGAVPVDVEFQACDDSRCLAPVRIELEAPGKEKR
jgi:uncharacterized protein YyaL (SSP411 family)